MFTITATEKSGFTKKDLATKIIKHLKIMYIVSKHYDVNTESLHTQELDWSKRSIFRSIMDWEYTHNTTMSIVYNGNEWEVVFADYI